MQKSNQLTQFLQQISSIMPHYCDKCGFKHNRSDLEIVNQDSDRIVCKLECSNCKNVYLFHVNSSMDGIINAKRAALKTDITGEEIKKFSNTEKIINEEVLDVFMALKNVTNIKDFNILFKENIKAL